ncbi:MAG: c-type cytochrome [Acidiferrobacterales bacterium]
MLKTVTAILILASAPLAAHASSMLLGNAKHGKKLYETQCAACHASQFGGDGSTIFTSKDRHVHSIEGLIGQVGRCNQQLNKQLSSSDQHDIVKYLNEAYYKF